MFRMRPQNSLSSDNPIHHQNKFSVINYFIFIFLLIAGTQTDLKISTAAVTNLIQVEDVCKNGPGTGSCFPINVTVVNKVLKVNNQNFMVKGVTYSAKPVATFLHYGSDFNGACEYRGQYDFGYPPYYLPHPEVRFERSSPDAQFACPYDPDVYQRDANILFRDMTTISEMNANTVRTYGKVTHELLDYAYAKGLKVIAGYWIDHAIDYSFPNIPGAPIENGALRRQTYIEDFVHYVEQFKNHPAVLMWGVSNENNLDFCNGCYIKGECNGGVQASGFYNFVNDMAKELIKDKDNNPNTPPIDANHPVIVTLADLNSGVQLYAPAMTDVGVIGVNAYRGHNFNGFPAGQPNLFDKFKSIFPNKSMIVTEFGADAWNTNGYDHDPKLGFEDQKAQKAFVVSQWNEIANNLTIFGGVVNGGIVHHLTDFWDGYGQLQLSDALKNKCDAWVSADFTSSVASHDHEFSNPEVFGKGIMPDDRVNPEWWGLLSLQKSQNGVCNNTSGIDCLLSREAYHALYSKFTNPLAKTDPTFNFGLTTSGATTVVQGSEVERIFDVWTGTPAVSKPVVLVLQNLPTGVHLKAPIQECPGINCRRTITLKVDSNAVPGTYKINVLGLANGYTAITNFDLSITQGPKRKNAVYDFDTLNLNPTTNLFSASDSNGNYQPGQLNNMDSNDQAGGVKGKALNFDGVNNYVKIPNFTWDNGPVTITFWSKVPSNYDKTKTTYAFGATNSWGERFSAHVPYVDGFLYWDYGDSNGKGRVKVDYKDHYDVWALVVLSSAGEGGNVRSAKIMSNKNGVEWISGESHDCIIDAGGIPCSDGPTFPFTEFQIGHSPENPVGTGHHQGLIDDFRIYNKVLTSAEVQAIYQEVYPRCGDQVCQSAETPLSCPTDCRTISCGDQSCGLDEYGRLEKYSTCPQDCPSSCGPQARICPVDRPQDCLPSQQTCNLNETHQNCAIDCPSTTCGNGRSICEGNGVDLFGQAVAENFNNCPIDCPLSTCGNSTCDIGENVTNCQTDCPLGQNLVVNGGFENKDQAWTSLSTSLSATRHVSTEQFSEGTHSAKFKVATLERYIYQRVQNLTPGKYRFSLQLYTGGLISGKTKIRVEWRKNGVSKPRATETIDLLSGANAFWVGWYKDLEMPKIPDQVINEVRIYLITEGGSGSVYFDDVKMQKFN